KVETRSRVLIADQNKTDIVDSEGYVSMFVNLNPGVNEILISVETYKHQKVEKVIFIEHPELDVPISLTSPPSISRTEKVIIKGVVEPETDVYVDTFKLAAEVDIEEDGTFKFTYSLNKYGWNEIEIIATSPDGKSSTLVHRIDRVPNHHTYTRVAHKMDFEQLNTMAGSIVGRIFKCTGTVHSRIETETSRMYKFDVGTDVVNYIMIEYNGRHDFEIGEQYDVYADVAGVYENYPHLIGRFIYPIEEETPEEPTTDTTDE
ncbi:MAG: hypothetical protein KAQ68_10150, partial [Clostridiales bacterium]|nr:hypothetical protein [Clostridiales bacterium]